MTIVYSGVLNKTMRRYIAGKINCFKGGSSMNKKRIAYTVIFALIVTTILPFVAIDFKEVEAETPPNLVKYYGDADGDGQVTAKDITIIQRVINKENNPTALQKETLDLNGDGNINNTDYELMQEYVYGKKCYFPVEKVWYGDINLDNQIDITDSVMCERIKKKIADNVTDDMLQRADVNGDGQVDDKDKTLFTQYIQKIIQIFPVCNMLKELQVKTEPHKSVYVEGEALDTSGMVIEAYYNNGYHREVKNYSVSGTLAKVGKNEITISYYESGVTKTVTYNVVVKEVPTPTPPTPTPSTPTPPTPTPFICDYPFPPSSKVTPPPESGVTPTPTSKVTPTPLPVTPSPTPSSMPTLTPSSPTPSSMPTLTPSSPTPSSGDTNNGNNGTIGDNNSNSLDDKNNNSRKQTIKAKSYTKAYGSKPFMLKCSTDGDGTLSFVSSNKKVAIVSVAGKVTIKGYGKTVITITASETKNYDAASKQITVKVLPKKTKIKKLYVAGMGRIFVSWKKVSGINGYEIRYSSDIKFRKKKGKKKVGYLRYCPKAKQKSVTTPAVWKAYFQKNKMYYVKIRTYKKVGKKTYYSEWSGTRAIKAK